MHTKNVYINVETDVTIGELIVDDAQHTSMSMRCVCLSRLAVWPTNDTREMFFVALVVQTRSFPSPSRGDLVGRVGILFARRLQITRVFDPC